MRLLLVEDDVRVSALLRRAFEDDGYAVDVSGDGDEAAWLGDENEYDAVVLDGMLPGLDGLEIVRRWRAGGRWHPVVMLTARSSIDARVAGLDAGADDFLAKPFSYAELAARVRALVRRGGPERPPVLQVGDLVLDPAIRTVSRSGTSISLTAREFALLELLMRHSDTVLSRTYILEHVWDYSYDPSSNVVDQHMGALRRKIDKPFGRDELRAVRGVGYRLCPADGA